MPLLDLTGIAAAGHSYRHLIRGQRPVDELVDARPVGVPQGAQRPDGGRRRRPLADRPAANGASTATSTAAERSGASSPPAASPASSAATSRSARASPARVRRPPPSLCPRRWRSARCRCTTQSRPCSSANGCSTRSPENPAVRPARVDRCQLPPSVPTASRPPARRSSRRRRSRSRAARGPRGPSRGSVRCWVSTAPTPERGVGDAGADRDVGGGRGGAQLTGAGTPPEQ